MDYRKLLNNPEISAAVDIARSQLSPDEIEILGRAVGTAVEEAEIDSGDPRWQNVVEAHYASGIVAGAFKALIEVRGAVNV